MRIKPKRRLLSLLGFLFLSSTLLSATPNAVSSQSDYVQSLIHRARSKRLWDQRYWKILLQYRSGLFGTRSEIRNASFFLSKNGRRNPQAEMEATLRGFFLPPGKNPGDQAQCRFPARLAWLKKRLAIDLKKLPAVRCLRFDGWEQKLSASSATLIFASAYLDNPASMYGHTFLRLDQKGHDANEKLLDYAVNFSAITDTNNGVLFAIDGLTGVFPGRFSAMPYYLKVQEYNNLESRAIWEYDLSLNVAEVHRLTLFLWEMGRADFSYYFINKNCSYWVLVLLEAARPSLHLTDHWPLYTIPVDTVRDVLRHDLVAKEKYRPSQVSQALYERSLLKPDEIRVAAKLASKRGGWKTLHELPLKRQAAVLDTALDYLQYLNDYRRSRYESSAALTRRLLLARGNIPIVSPPLDIPAPAPPESGHETGRLSLNYGYEGGPLMEASWRPALHDLLDRTQGYVPGSELEMLNTRFGYDLQNYRAYLREMDLVKITSLTPANPWVLKPSWNLSAGWRTADELALNPTEAGYAGLSLGGGLTIKTDLLGGEMSYALIEVDGDLGGIFHGGYRLGGGPEIGTIISPVSWWSVQFEAAYLDYGLGDTRSYARAKVESAFDLSPRVSLRLFFQTFGPSREYFMGFQRYF